jgi:uncharacterized membrane protein YoaK (UPF0700 family)
VKVAPLLQNAQAHARITGQLRAKRHLAIVLAAVAGAVDAIGYLTLFHLFTAHMSGNTVALATHLGRSEWAEALRRGFTIFVFAGGVAIGRLLTRAARTRGIRSSFTIIFGMEALVLIAFMLIGSTMTPGSLERGTLRYFVLASLPALSMGVQNATLRCVGGHTVRTTFITGMLTSLVDQLVRLAFSGRPSPAPRPLARLTLLAAIWSTYLTAAIAASALESSVHFWSVLVPVGGLIVAMMIDTRRWHALAAMRRRSSQARPPRKHPK